MIKLSANCAPALSMKCMYQHAFRYAYADTGSKNKPSCNIPVKCELCHPALPPEPGRTSWRALPVAIDTVWRYNMPEHILMEHKEYAVPGYRMIGAPLPANMLKVMALTDLEQTAVRIPEERRLPTCAEDPLEKENDTGSSSRSAGKCRALQPAASLPAKRARTAMQPLQPRTSIVG